MDKLQANFSHRYLENNIQLQIRLKEPRPQVSIFSTPTSDFFFKCRTESEKV